MKNKYLFSGVKEALHKRVIRFLYHKYVDDLHIPKDHNFNRVGLSDSKTFVVSCSTNSVRRGQQEVFLRLK